MHHLLLAIIALSALVQFAAAFLAIRLIRLSNSLCAWIILSAGFVVQGLRRALALYHALEGSPQDDLGDEMLGLLVSLLMLCGVWFMGPLFRRIRETRQALLQKQEELAQSHEQLAESETRYRTVADFTADMEFWIAPDKSSIRYMSPSCREITGYSADQFYADPQLITAIVHPEDLAVYDRHTEDLLENGQPRPIDFRIVTRDGEERWLSHVCRAVIDQDGRPLGWRASNRDITRRKHIERVLRDHTVMLEHEVARRRKAQEDLAAKQSELEGLNRTLERRVRDAVEELRSKDQVMFSQSRHAAMGEMISYIAHQWRNPLNHLGLVLQGLRQEHANGKLSPEQMAQYVGKGMELITFMSHTIDDFRYFFRVNKAKEPFSARDTITKAISLVEASLKDNNIRVVVEPGEDLLIEGFSNEYAQVLLTLLSNARDVLLERGVAEPVIRVRLFREEGCTVLTLSDNGGGVPDDIIERIFDPYFTTKGEGKGTGIGLYMAKTVIEKSLGGRLLVRNIDGGAEFRIEV